MTVAAPRDAHWLRRLLYTAQLPDRKGPMSIRYPRGNATPADWKCELRSVEIGRGECLTEGEQVAVLSIGTMAAATAEAVARARREGIDAAHYDMVFLSPLDESILDKVGRSGAPVITVEDGVITGGLGSAVMEWLNSHGYSNHVERVGVPDSFVTHGTVGQLHKMLGMDADSICERIIQAAHR